MGDLGGAVMRNGLLILALVALTLRPCSAAEWLTRVALESDLGTVRAPADGVLHFLEIGGHSFAPDSIQHADPRSIPIGLFQQLRAVEYRVPNDQAGTALEVRKQPVRDPFWDQILVVNPQALGELPRLELIETGEFGEALPAAVRDQSHSKVEIRRQRESLMDPVIPERPSHEISWQELESAAYPLDFQKVLVASRTDASPGFAYQNGQWFTTWLSHDLPKWTKEDHWFAPAIRIGDKLVRPAPLSVTTKFMTTDDGVTLPMWTLEWRYGEATVTQTLFSQRAAAESDPAVFVQLRLEHAPVGAQLALGMGRRPNCHYWDDKSRERTPIAFFTLPPNYRRDGRTILDGAGKVILESAQELEFESCGPVEMLATFEPDPEGNVYLRTPQTESKIAESHFGRRQYEAARAKFDEEWSRALRAGAQVRLPSKEWMRRIDIWQSQVAAITRVNYQGAERLSYGAGFYQAYFGPEEGWPIVALAQWGRGGEAKRQAEIMLSAENRDKSNVHHQSRNGTAAWYTAEVARLTRDAEWLAKVTTALDENAEWTIAARRSTAKNKSPLTRGLLPAHIYGGDVRDPATSFYASMVCYKGLVETAAIYRELGSPAMKSRADRYEQEAVEFRKRLVEVMNAAVDEHVSPPFLPLALDVPSLDGKNEGPYERLTASRYGNYWNLFAPSVLELGLTLDVKRDWPNALLLDTMSQHGGLWAMLPRFNTGLDAAYSIGIQRELQRRSRRDVRERERAIAGLQALFLHAASRNGYTIPEVAGLFPDRLERAAYERLVRESPWSFGMYDDNRYLDGHISFTEPLGAAAGEALWLIRDALVCEERDENGLPNGELVLLANVPSEWFAEGNKIELKDFPTAYGTLGLRVRSSISASGKLSINYHFAPTEGVRCPRVRLRVSPAGFPPREVELAPDAAEGTMEIDFKEQAETTRVR
jgi:hypothetical protein